MNYPAMRLPGIVVTGILGLQLLAVPESSAGDFGNCLKRASSSVECTAPVDYWIVSSRDHRFSDGDGKLKWYKHLKDTGLRDSNRCQFDHVFQRHVPVCIFVHGSLVDWKTIRVDTYYTYQWLCNARKERQVQFVSFTWPSSRLPLCAPVDYGVLGRRASRHGHFLARLIASLPPETPICVMGHSHGTRVTLAALHLLAGGEVRGRRLACPQRPHNLRTILVAAAVDHDWLNPGERFDRALSQTRSVLNVVNRRDFALGFYPYRKLICGEDAMGHDGITRCDVKKLGNRAGKIQQLDVTRRVNRGHLWPSYYEDDVIASTICDRVFCTGHD